MSADVDQIVSVRSNHDLVDLLDRTCWRDGSHVVLHDSAQEVWVGYISEDGESYVAHPPHRSACSSDIRGAAWLEDLILPTGEFPDWRFPMTVLWSPAPQSTEPGLSPMSAGHLLGVDRGRRPARRRPE
jgi:hypothetical protein